MFFLNNWRKQFHFCSKQRHYLVAAEILVLASLTACTHKPIIETWASRGEQKPNVQKTTPIAYPPQNTFVWAGTVSHHLLTDPLISDWFAQLASRRTVDTFFILSPSHWHLSTQTWSLGDCTWKCGHGKTITTNTKIERQLAHDLNVTYDMQVFPEEHGINTLIPYIAQYFPQAKVVIIALHGEPPLNQSDAEQLQKALAPYFTPEQKQQNFLLISTDFAHHGNFEGTQFKDTRTKEFFKSPSQTSWIFCGCDNRPGIYCLAHFLTTETHCSILYHTNSFALSGHDENDITSYFFTFFYDKK